MARMNIIRLFAVVNRLAPISALMTGLGLSADSGLSLSGNIYPPALLLPGDQVLASAAFGSKGGVIVWQDNTLGGSYVVRGRLLAPDLSAGPGPFYVSASIAGDQENPQVTVGSDGRAAIVWQSGLRENQKVKLRILGANAVFGAEINVSGSTTNSLANETTPSVALLSNGTTVVVWRTEAQVGQPSQVSAQEFDFAGKPFGSVIQVNDYGDTPQRAPSVTALSSGGFAVAWISEEQSGVISADAMVRLFDSQGVAGGPAIQVNDPQLTVDSPKLAGLSNGNILAVWTQIDTRDNTGDWNVASRVLAASGAPTGATAVVNTTQIGSQLSPQIASSGTEALVVWRSGGDPATAPAILAQTLDNQGQKLGTETILSAGKKGNQIYPAAAGSPNGQYLAVWTTFSSLDTGNDLYAQRLVRGTLPLVAMPAPFIYPQAPTRLVVSWLGVQGQPVDHYDVFIDGSPTPVSTNGFCVVTAPFAPSSLHTAAVRYVLTDGRLSDLSPLASGTTWGEDANGDGLPDDWETQYFGTDPSQWPDPNSDPNGIGMTVRDAFLAGVDPTCKACALRVQVIKAADGLRVSWNSVPGRTYKLQVSNDLKNWSDYGDGFDLAVSGTTSVLLNSGPAGAYFRVNFIR
jgi:hypothetical protein